MKNGLPNELLTPRVKSNLERYCEELHNQPSQRQVDSYSMNPSILLWTGIKATGLVTFLGIKLKGRIYNLIGDFGHSEPQHVQIFNKAKPFGEPIGNSPWVVFLDVGTDTFRFGSIPTQHRYKRGTKINIKIGERKRLLQVDTSLVAPILLSDEGESPYTADPSQHLPASALSILVVLDGFLNHCSNSHVLSYITPAEAAIKALRVLNTNGKVPETVIRDIDSAAQKFKHATSYMRKHTRACASEQASPDTLDEMGRRMQILACRARVFNVTGEVSLFQSQSEEDFMHYLAELPAHHEGRVAIDACKAKMQQVRPSMVNLLRSQGMEVDSSQILTEKFERVLDACKSDSSPYSKKGSAMDHLNRLAKDRVANLNLWKTALKRNSNAISHTCQVASEQLIEELKENECRNTYLSVLSKHGVDRSKNAATSTQSLAYELVSHLESSSNSEGELANNAALASCLRENEVDLSHELSAKARAINPSFGNAEITSRLDQKEKEVRRDIVEEQDNLRKACERDDSPTQEYNPFPKGSHVTGQLAQLLQPGGFVDILKVAEATAVAEKRLSQPVDNESTPHGSARKNCSKTIHVFERNVRKSLCRLRIYRRLGIPPPSSNTDEDDVALVALWLDTVSSDTLTEHETSIDTACAHTMSAVSSRIADHASKESTRKCSTEVDKSVMAKFCTSMVTLSIPFRIIDFLSLLTLAALEPWPYSQESMKSDWLSVRRSTLKTSDGREQNCASSVHVIETYSPSSDATPTTAFKIRSEAVRGIIEHINTGTSLKQLSDCMCNSQSVISQEKREQHARATRWYWECGLRLVQEASDRDLISKARQRISDRVIESSVQSVSLVGTTTLKPRRSRGESLYSVMWNSYMELMFGGILDSFRRRIEAKHPKEPQCQLALVDTFFFIVLLSLCGGDDDALIPENALSRIAGRSQLTTKNAALGSLALVALGGLSMASPDNENVAMATKAAQSAIAVAGESVLKETAKEALKPHVNPETFSHEPASRPRASVLSRGYQNAYDAANSFKTEAVNNALQELCDRALHDGYRAHKIISPRRFNFNDQGERAHSFERRRKNTHSASPIPPPACFPLSPPNAGNPSIECMATC